MHCWGWGIHWHGCNLAWWCVCWKTCNGCCWSSCQAEYKDPLWRGLYEHVVFLQRRGCDLFCFLSLKLELNSFRYYNFLQLSVEIDIEHSSLGVFQLDLNSYELFRRFSAYLRLSHVSFVLQVWGGNPARFLRKLSEDEMTFFSQSALNYSNLAQAHAAENAKKLDETEFVKVLGKKSVRLDEHGLIQGDVHETPQEINLPDNVVLDKVPKA